MLKSTVERFGGAVGRAGPIEVGEQVSGSALECAAERDELGQRGWDAGAERIDDGAHQGPPAAPVFVAVGGDDALVDAPGRFDLGMVVGGEQRFEPCAQLLGEQIVGSNAMSH